MADLHIVCVKSAVTEDLKALSNREEAVTYLVIPAANISLANAELANYASDDYVSSTTVEGKSGYTTEGIRLPEEAVTG